MSSVRMIEHFTGFGLYDKSFISILRELDDPIPFLRGIVAEYGSGFNMIEIDYEQAKRRAGKTHNNFYSLYDAAMLSFTSYTKVGLRRRHLSGIYLVRTEPYCGVRVSDPEADPLVQLPGRLCASCDRRFCDPVPFSCFFIGLLGEYILNINTRVIHRPLVVEERRINFEDVDEE